MKPSEIKVGCTYSNKGAGKTQRKVIAIGNEYRPKNWWGLGQQPDEPGVLYEQKEKQNNIYISSFAAWCGNEVA